MSAVRSMPTPQSLVARAKTVSSLPSVFLRLQNVVNDPRSSNRDIANVIGEDPGLSARLLRVANSAFYGFPSKIDTITRAVTVIGGKQLRDISLATTVIDLFKGLPQELVSMESFWRHSIACAVAARILATYRRASNVEHFFVVGLLHDLGCLIMYSEIPDQCREVFAERDREGALLYPLERKLLGFDHADVGGLLLDSWKLPSALSQPVTHHHRPGRLQGQPEIGVTAAIIHLADILAHAMELGSSGEYFVPPLDADAWAALALPESVLPAILRQFEQQYEDALALVDLGGR
ncbi:MAG: HDOD domain-containing protein [Gammaproteobacteria bacterium]|nr:HDOD domain-containing protein [Gammaproteobacteria bacterium]